MRRTWIKYKLRDGETRRVETYSCQRKHTGGICSAPAHVMAHTIEPVVIDHFLTWHGLTERTEQYSPTSEDLRGGRAGAGRRRSAPRGVSGRR